MAPNRTPKQNFAIGEDITCVYKTHPYDATIIGIENNREGKECYCVHFKGWNCRYDEKIVIGEEKDRIFKGTVEDYYKKSHKTVVTAVVAGKQKQTASSSADSNGTSSGATEKAAKAPAATMRKSAKKVDESSSEAADPKAKAEESSQNALKVDPPLTTRKSSRTTTEATGAMKRLTVAQETEDEAPKETVQKKARIEPVDSAEESKAKGSTAPMRKSAKKVGESNSEATDPEAKAKESSQSALKVEPPLTTHNSSRKTVEATGAMKRLTVAKETEDEALKSQKKARIEPVEDASKAKGSAAPKSASSRAEDGESSSTNDAAGTRFVIGELVACTYKGKVYDAVITDIKPDKDGKECYCIHFKGWNNRYDEQIPIGEETDRIFKGIADGYRAPVVTMRKSARNHEKSTEPQATKENAPRLVGKRREQFIIGEQVTCTQNGKPYDAYIVDIITDTDGKDFYCVHFKGWNSRYDEKIPVGEEQGRLFKGSAAKYAEMLEMKK